jgi:hypothetical protein
MRMNVFIVQKPDVENIRRLNLAAVKVTATEVTELPL